MNDVEPTWLEVRAIGVARDVEGLARYACGRRCVTDNPNGLGLRVKLGRLDFNLTLGCGMRPRVVREVYRSRLKAEDVAHERADVDLWVRLHDLNHVLEVHGAVTLHLKLLCVRLSNKTGFAHVDEFWEQFILRRIDDWKRMDWD